MAGSPRPISWLRDNVFAADAIFAVGLAAVSVPMLWIRPTHSIDYRDTDALAVVLVLAQALPLAWRRQNPTAVLITVAGAAVMSEAFGYRSTAATFAVLVALYTVGSLADRRHSMRAGVIAAATLLFAFAVARDHPTFGDMISTTIVFGTALILGDRQRTRRAYTSQLEARARQLETERESRARQAVTEERTRIARELHDVVAHNVSVMVVQAGAARRTLDRDPETAREAMLSIEETGREALDEMRRLLGVLRHEGEDRDPSPALAPQPTVGELETLVSQLREAGLAVDLEVEGEPRPLASGVDLSAFRIVQEALTNTLKHAGPASAAVCLRYGENDLELRITDDGRGAGSTVGSAVGTANREGYGHGLIGMQERVALCGGQLEVGPRPGGGFQVRARELPLAATRV